MDDILTIYLRSKSQKTHSDKIKYKDLCSLEETSLELCNKNKLNTCEIFETLYNNCMQFKTMKLK
jgi:hypothetical protein